MSSLLLVILLCLIGCNGYINSTWDESLYGTISCEEKIYTICPATACDTAAYYQMNIAILDNTYMISMWTNRMINRMVNSYSTISNLHTTSVDVIGYLGEQLYNNRPQNVLISSDNSKIIYVYIRHGGWKWILYHTIYAGSNNTMYSLGERIVEPTMVTVPSTLQGFGSVVWTQAGCWMTTDDTYAIILGNSTTFTTTDANLYLLIIDISTHSYIGLDQINIRDGTLYTNDSNVNVRVGICYLYDDDEQMDSRSYTDTFLLIYPSFLYGIDECNGKHIRAVKYKQHRKISDTVKLHYFNYCDLNERYYHSLQCSHNPGRHEILVCASSISTSNKKGIKCVTLDDHTLRPIENDAILMNDIEAHYTAYTSIQYQMYGVICNGLGRCGLINHRRQFMAVKQIYDSNSGATPFMFKISESSFLYILIWQRGNISKFWNCSIETYNRTKSPSMEPTMNPMVTESTELLYSSSTITDSTTDGTQRNELTDYVSSVFEESNVSKYIIMDGNKCTITPLWIMVLSVIGLFILIGIIVVILLQIRIYKKQHVALETNDNEDDEKGRIQMEDNESCHDGENETESIRIM